MMFDPNAQLPDFQSQQSQIERQRAMAAALRKQAQQPMPEGKMVSGIYVRPHWAEYLPSIFNQGLAAYQENKAAQAEEEYNRGVQQATSDWQSSLPRSRAAVEGRPELAGPRAGDGSPELDAVEAVPAELPSREAVLAATLRGMQIPGNAKNAELWSKGMQELQTREDQQAARAEEKRLQREVKLAEVNGRLDVARERLAWEERNGKASDETKRYIAELSAEARKYAADVAAAARRDSGNKEKPPGNLPSSQTKAWIENNSALQTIDRALAEVDANPKAFGLKNMLPEAITQRMDPKGVDARALVANLGSLKIHDRSGAAVSAMEFPRLRPFVPDVRYDDQKTILKKLNQFRIEYEQMQQEIKDLAGTQNWKDPGDWYRRKPKEEKGGTPPQDGVEETKVLDGVTYVKKNGNWYQK